VTTQSSSATTPEAAGSENSPNNSSGTKRIWLLDLRRRGFTSRGSVT
jgi:hypothetical protein